VSTHENITSCNHRKHKCKFNERCRIKDMRVIIYSLNITNITAYINVVLHTRLYSYNSYNQTSVEFYGILSHLFLIGVTFSDLTRQTYKRYEKEASVYRFRDSNKTPASIILKTDVPPLSSLSFLNILAKILS
jgi:hypothetical protein